MFLTRYKQDCNVFIWIDQPISHGIKERLSSVFTAAKGRKIPSLWKDIGDV